MSVRHLASPGASPAPGLPANDIRVSHTVYLIPGMGGDSVRLARFRASCGERIRFVLLDYPDWRALVPGVGDMHAMVASHVETILRTAPDEPVVLAGYSLGAAVAYGVAAALEARGQRVGLLATIDGEARPFSKDMFRKRGPVGLHRRVYWITAKYAGAARRGEALDLTMILATSALLRPNNWGKLRLLARLPAGPCPHFLRRRFRRYLREGTQLRLVEPWAAALAPARKLAAPTVLFRSNDHPVAMGEDLGWGRLCADLEIVHVPGTHETMLAGANAMLLRRLDVLGRAGRTGQAVIAPSTGSATPEM